MGMACNPLSYGPNGEWDPGAEYSSSAVQWRILCMLNAFCDC